MFMKMERFLHPRHSKERIIANDHTIKVLSLAIFLHFLERGISETIQFYKNV